MPAARRAPSKLRRRLLLVQAVALAARDPLFRRTQDYFADQLYFTPSQQLAKQYGIRCDAPPRLGAGSPAAASATW